MKKITYFNVLVFTVLLLTMGGCNAVSYTHLRAHETS